MKHPFATLFAPVLLLAACDQMEESTVPEEVPTIMEVTKEEGDPEKPAAPSGTGTEVVHVEAAAAAALLAGDAKPTVLDVRTPGEFAEGHITGATNIDFRAATFAEEAGKLDKGASYLVHCRSGGRSGESLKVFEELGFEKIYHLDGGIMAWEEAGQPLEK
jgi:rhodanese-related sulfurtransferase